MQTDVNMRLVVGSDWCVYVEWLDIYGQPVASAEGSIALMQVRRTSGNTLLVEFSSTNNPETQACAVVLGTSGVIRLSCPREVTTALPVGSYNYDLVVEHKDPERTLWPTGQRAYVMSGKFEVLPRVTNAEPITGGGALAALAV